MDGVAIRESLCEQLIAHALAEAPNECCGIGAYDRRVRKLKTVTPAENVARSPMRFELGSSDLLAIPRIEESGLTPVIYHSHTRSAAEPSQTDLTFAGYWPGVPWLIIGLQQDPPELRWFEIDSGEVTEHAVQRTAD